MSNYIEVDVDTSVSVHVRNILPQMSDELLEEELKKRGKTTGNVAVAKIINSIDIHLSTEEVKEVYDFIAGSYHYDVFKGELDEKVNENT